MGTDVALNEDLLLAIARCPEVPRAERDPAHPCARVVAAQDVDRAKGRHVPEPWNGALASAPILFLSSNPSYDPREPFPARDSPDRQIVDFFAHRFQDWIDDGIRPKVKDGTGRKQAVRFLSEVRSRATELLDEKARPGVDYVLSEIVHCKSARRVGVARAAPLCTRRWLDPLLQRSGAAVVLVMGVDAGGAVRDHLGIDRGVLHHIDADGRHYAFLGAPGGPHPRRLSALFDEPTRARLRAAAWARRPPA